MEKENPPPPSSSPNWLPKASTYFEIGPKFVGFSAPIIWIYGFAVFLRYCLEISYFPDLDLSAFAAFLAAIFSLGFIIALGGLMLWYIPIKTLKDDLRKWEGFQAEGKGLVIKIHLWVMLSTIYPFLILSSLLGTKPLEYKGDTGVLNLLVFLPLLMGIFLPFAKYLPFHPPPSTPLPKFLIYTLCFLGAFWGEVLFTVLAIAHFAAGPPGAIVATLAVLFLLLFSMGATIPEKDNSTLIITSFVAFLFVLLTIVPPFIPTIIVRSLGIGAYEKADLVVEKRCCEALVAEGLPLVGNPASWNEEMLKDKYDKKSFSYILVMNGDTVILKHIQVLLRIGSQIAIRNRVPPEKQQEIVDRRIILLPSTQVLQLLSR